LRTERKQVETYSNKNSIKDSTTGTHSRRAKKNPRKIERNCLGKMTSKIKWNSA
jgi:hypothetical protein